MNGTLSKPQLWEKWKEAKQLALLATFDDSTTGTRVKDFCQQLSKHLGEQCRLVEHVWLFSTFRLKELQEIAAEEASTSDLVIISVHQAQGLPDEVKHWIDLWQHKDHHAATLLALLDPPHEDEPVTVQAYLQEVASRANMEFVVESQELPETRWRAS